MSKIKEFYHEEICQEAIVDDDKYFQLLTETEWTQYCEEKWEEITMKHGYGLHAKLIYNEFLNKNI
jgi:hypothetical protein